MAAVCGLEQLVRQIEQIIAMYRGVVLRIMRPFMIKNNYILFVRGCHAPSGIPVHILLFKGATLIYHCGCFGEGDGETTLLLLGHECRQEHTVAAVQP